MNWLREPDAEPLPGYRLISPLGTGGFGEVWKCAAPGNLLKAIKFVYGNLESLDGDGFRAEQEHKALQRIRDVRHPFVLSTERIDIVGGELAIVMELADKSLHDLNVEYQQLGQPGVPRRELLGYMRDAADGLDHLIEKHNLQHLDVKPRNLFLIGDRVKVADFGLVKNLERQSSSGLLAGVTPIYAAPETFGGKVSKHTDQYSLAIVYCELLTGKRPFNGKNIRLLALQHVSEEPDLSALPEYDRPVVARALAKNPEDRFPSCLAFVRALFEADYRSEEVRLGELPVPTSHSTPPITPRNRDSSPSLPTIPRPIDEVPVIGLDVTKAQVEVGVLRPTILIGLGGFGRRALLDLRCRLLDRFGDLAQVPVYRFLYIDSDPEAVHKALYDAPEVALSSTEVFPLPLQPVANYRRRTLEHLGDWLPREKLYSIPRSLQPQGSRALGRLAFADNFLRFMTRIRRELQVATHPESLAQSLAQTGLSLRDNRPRVCILASATGGSAGILIDLSYAIMKQMAQLHLAVSQPNMFLFCGAPSDPATPRSELANVYATLTEINHYADASTTFGAQYGP
ncbi:MAG: serine/threonine protein kinase, partial [Gemmataceae bacterium]